MAEPSSLYDRIRKRPNRSANHYPDDTTERTNHKSSYVVYAV